MRTQGLALSLCLGWRVVGSWLTVRARGGLGSGLVTLCWALLLWASLVGCGRSDLGTDDLPTSGFDGGRPRVDSAADAPWFDVPRVPGDVPNDVNPQARQLAIVPAMVRVRPGQWVSLRVVEKDNFGRQTDVTNQVAWTVPSVFTFTRRNDAFMSTESGVYQVHASYGGRVATAVIEVGQANLVAIRVTPEVASTAIDGVIRLTATAEYSDGTNSDVTYDASWSSASERIASVLGAGLVQGRQAGTVQLRAVFQGLTGLGVVEVTSAQPKQLRIEPSVATVQRGETVDLRAILVMSDGTESDMTSSAWWSSSRSDVAQLSGGSAPGHVYGRASGAAIVTATYGGLSAAAEIDVASVELRSIWLSPSDLVLAAHSEAPVSVRARYSDGTVADVTTQATWSTRNGRVAWSSDGRVRAVREGRTIIDVSVGGAEAQLPVTVIAPKVVSLEVSPIDPRIMLGSASGNSTRMQAMAYYDDGTSQDVTRSVRWSVEDTNVASIGSDGVARARGPGKTVVRADLSGLRAETSLTVQAEATVSSLTIAPSKLQLSIGKSTSVRIIAQWTDGSSADVTRAASCSVESEARPVPASISAGVVNGLARGNATLVCRFGGSGAKAAISVSASPGDSVQSLSISPNSPIFTVGSQVRLRLWATFVDGTVSDVSSLAQWTSDRPESIVVVPSGAGAGTISARQPGWGVTIRASYAGSTATAVATALQGSTNTLVIDPPSVSLDVDAGVLLRALVRSPEGTVTDVTTRATWSVESPAIASVDGGLITGRQSGSTSVRAVYDGLSALANVVVISSKLERLEVQPFDASIAVGATQQAVAVAYYFDGHSTEVTERCAWSTSDPSAATISVAPGSRGVVTGVGAGRTVRIRCIYEGVAAESEWKVTPSPVVSLSISPSGATCRVGEQIQLRATATMADGSSLDISELAEWNVIDFRVLRPLPSRGSFQCFASGYSAIWANYQGARAQATVVVSRVMLTGLSLTPSVAKGTVGSMVLFEARALYNDGSSRVVTNEATWHSGNPSVVQVAGGKALAVALGRTSVHAEWSAFAAEASFEVSNAKLVSLYVTPPSPLLPTGEEVRFNAEASYSDGTRLDVTDLATWSSTAPSVATITDAVPKGVGRTVSTGVAKVTATFMTATGAATILVANGTVAGLEVSRVTPYRPRYPIGFTVQYKAEVVSDDGSRIDVTPESVWLSSNTRVATAIAPSGAVNTVGAGTASILAAFVGMQGTAVIDVTSAKMTGIQITPSTSAVPAGFVAYLTATALYDDGSSFVVTDWADWRASGSNVVVSNAPGTKGRVVANTRGTGRVAATWADGAGSADVTVVEATLRQIVISPNPAIVRGMDSLPLSALGVFDGGLTLDLTREVNWTSSDPTIAVVSNSASTQGLVTSRGVGQVRVSAARGTVSGETVVNVVR